MTLPRETVAKACRCGEAHGDRLSRRALAGGLFGGLLALPAANALAQSGLLPPSAITPKKPVTSDGPAYTPGNAAGASNGLSWAGSITNSLLTVMLGFADQAGKYGGLKVKEDELSKQLQKALLDKASKLDEYRKGMFCSGCGRTKSEILARGETFPHPGQTIVMPTPEQIAAKERELQAIIDRLQTDFSAARKATSTSKGEIDEADDQLKAGMDLWRVSVAYTRSAILHQDEGSIVPYVRDRKQAIAGADSVVAAAADATTSAQLTGLLDELQMWVKMIARLDDQRLADWQGTQSQLLNLATRAQGYSEALTSKSRTLSEQLKDQYYAGTLRGRAYPLSTGVDAIARMNYRGESDAALGIRFRMGNYSPSSRGQILSSVSTFLDTCKTTPYYSDSRMAGAPRRGYDRYQSQTSDIVARRDALLESEKGAAQ